MGIRPETFEAYEKADFIERVYIRLWIIEGWDKYYPWTNVPAWLAPYWKAYRVER